MGLGKVVGGLRKFLGKLTDILLLGRSAGLWDKKSGPTDFKGGK